MKYKEIHPTLRAYFGSWQVLRLMGFESDDLYCVVERSVQLRGAYSCFVQLQTQDLEFTIECGPVGADPNGFLAEYTRVAKLINERAISREVLDRILFECEAFQKKVDLIMSLEAKGFRIPKLKEPNGL